MTDLNKESITFITKILIPSFIISIIGIAVEMKHNRAKFLNSFLSIIISVGTAYIFSDYILEVFENKYIVLVVALISITADKVISFFLFKFNIDLFLAKLFDAILEYLKSKLK